MSIIKRSTVEIVDFSFASSSIWLAEKNEQVEGKEAYQYNYYFQLLGHERMVFSPYKVRVPWM